MAEKCTRNIFSVSLHCCLLLMGSDCNLIQYCDNTLPLPHLHFDSFTETSVEQKSYNFAEFLQPLILGKK